MTVIPADVFGSPNIGTYCYCNEDVVIVPPGLTNRKMGQLEEALGVSVCKTTIAGSTLVGALVCGNSKGLLVPHTIRDYEEEKLRAFTKVTIVNANWTALGNVVLTNDFGAVVHPDAPKEIMDAVSVDLGAMPLQCNVATLGFVGALGIATNKGVILSPGTIKEEQSQVESALRVEAQLSTINGGVPFVRSGILANSKGAVVGPLTRGAELMQISRALDL
jgi:translation initiation factor 6